MPRWAEGIGLVVAAMVILGAILVYAKFTTNQQKARAEATAEQTEATLKQAADIPDAPPAAQGRREVTDLDDARRAVAAGAERVTVTARARHARPPVPSKRQAASEPLVGPPLAAANLDRRQGEEPFVGPPLAARGEVQPLTAEQAAALAAAEGATEEEVEKVAAESAQGGLVTPGSKEELALIEQAHASLVRLHNLRLRSDLPPAQAQAEAERLSAILSRLPLETRKEVQAAIDEGYNRRLSGPRSEGNLQEDAASATDVRERELGRYDDTPADVRALRQRLRGGSRARPGGPPPAVNPSGLPAARSSTLDRSSDSGGLPEARPSNL